MEFSFDSHQRGAQSAPSAGADPASDRLRKAIERNRAKQAKRDNIQGQANSASTDGPLFSSSTGPRPVGAGSRNISERLRAAQNSGTPSGIPKRPASRFSSEPSAQMSSSGESGRSWGGGLLKKKEASEAEPSVTATRRTVGKPDEAEFLTPMRKAAVKAPAKVGYTSAKRKVNTKSKNNSDRSLVGYLVKFGWAFCTFLLFRLVFSGGGVMDYYSSLNLLEEKQYEQERIILENKNLAIEIKKIGKNSMYQKKLVRDNLGFIARDEYLILFPRDKSLSKL
ncbi:hypothetical protein [Halobacteriovorax sp. JY17]|uniref:FtsB family cell division protein n=1 Tax=Halobacteriovorax sp. JY17 TaxID=2014617 RepID=UPI000C38B866|nr:hypothetical protein [Halobacteriovorax sp. JY17]PIK16550.1 MAG: hypothetical protein CES88_07355 [Halobacteriovorax sp. JY17]